MSEVRTRQRPAAVNLTPRAEARVAELMSKAPADAIIVADGTSCRHQIHDGTGRPAIHVARALARSMEAKQDA